MPPMTGNTNPIPRGDTDMATVPIVTDGAAHSRVAVGADYSWDGTPLGMGQVCDRVDPSPRFAT